MDKIGVYEAKRSLSSLLRRVERGEAFSITRRGETIALLLPVHAIKSGGETLPKEEPQDA
jgi:prevent-host-death family protein